MSHSLKRLQTFDNVGCIRHQAGRSARPCAPADVAEERLRTDFEGGRIFRSDPIIPPELRQDFQC